METTENKALVFCSLCQCRLSEGEQLKEYLAGRKFCMLCRDLGVHDNMGAFREAKTRWLKTEVLPDVWGVYCRIVKILREVGNTMTVDDISDWIKRNTKVTVGPEQIETIAKQNQLSVLGM